MAKTKHPVRSLAFSAMCLTLCLVLPFVTGQIPQAGNALCPMHIPVLLAGFLCGPGWAAAVGLIAPLLRNALFHMPPLYPTGIAMCLELATYGLVSGLLYRAFPKKPGWLYAALLCAMAAGRLVWGAARAVMSGVSGTAFTWEAFLSGAVLTAIPGILVQLILIPVLVLALRRAGLTE